MQQRTLRTSAMGVSLGEKSSDLIEACRAVQARGRRSGWRCGGRARFQACTRGSAGCGTDIDLIVVVAVIADGLMAMVGVVGLFGAELWKWFDDRLVQQLGALGAGVYRHAGFRSSLGITGGAAIKKPPALF